MAAPVVLEPRGGQGGGDSRGHQEHSRHPPRQHWSAKGRASLQGDGDMALACAGAGRETFKKNIKIETKLHQNPACPTAALAGASTVPPTADELLLGRARGTDV